MPTPVPDTDPAAARPAGRVQQLLRWVWLIIGVLLLVLLLWAVVFIVRESAGGGDGGSSAADSARSDSAGRKAVEPLRYDPPDAIRGSDVRIVLIRRGSGYRYGSRSASARGEGPTVNVVFLEGSGARLLLDRPAYINRVRYPEAGAQADSLRWIVYEMAMGDTDRNGDIDESDARSLYVTDLGGRGLRRVLPPGYQLLDWAPQPGGSLIVTAALITKDGKPMPERAFLLDAAGTVKPYAALDAMVDEAARIVATP